MSSPLIRKLVAKAQMKMNLVKERNTYHIPAWVEDPPSSSTTFSGGSSTNYFQRGSKFDTVDDSSPTES